MGYFSNYSTLCSHMYSASYWICTRFCRALLIYGYIIFLPDSRDSINHIFQDFMTGAEATVWPSQTSGVYLKDMGKIGWYMMTSSNGNISRVTGPLCGEFTGPGEFPTQRPVTRNFDVFFDLRLYKRLSKQPRGWWFETSSWSLWRQCNDLISQTIDYIIRGSVIRSTISAWFSQHM